MPATPPLSRLHAGWRGHLLAALAGAAVTLSLAPYEFWPLGVISCAALAWLLTGLAGAQAALRGWWYGLGLFGAGTSWVYYSIHDYGYASVPLALFLTVLFSLGLALFIALPAWLYGRWVQHWRWGPTLGFAAVWLLAEWLRSWLLTGFPWLYLGYGHLHTLLAGWAPLAGVLAPGFIVALTGAVLVHYGRALARAPLAWVTLALWLAGGGLSLIEWSRPAGPPLRVAAVQANIPQGVKWNPDWYQRTLRTYNRLSRDHWRKTDILVWPEAAIPTYYDRARPFLDKMAEIATATDTAFITGIPTRDLDSGAQYNSIVVLGEGGGVYHKQHLVPFGEYVPLQQWLRGLIAFFDLPMSNFQSGAKNQPPLRANGVTLAPFICYEVVYPNLVSSWLPAADLLITISNDAWFGTSIGPLQHQQMAQMRALEAGRDLIRATGSGLTTLVNHRGQITAAIPQFQPAVLTGSVQPRKGATPFSYTGNWTMVVIGVLVLLGSAAAGRGGVRGS